MAVIEALQSWLSFSLLQLGDYNLRVANIASAAGILLLSVIIQRLVSRASEAAAKRSGARDQNIYIIKRILKYLIYGIGLILALSALGVGLSNLILVAGALGVGIGFGLQSIVNNFVCGIIILFEKSLRIGDFVELPGGLLGEVREINIRSTLIRTLENADILVPNADFISNQVNNWTLNDDIRRFSIHFSVAYGSDLEKVREAGLKAANEVPLTLQRENIKPDVLVTELGSSGLECILTVWAEGEWVKRPGLVKSQYLTAIYNNLREAGLEIPFPQVDVHMR
jgi:small-conductance mechanosensitive channel